MKGSEVYLEGQNIPSGILLYLDGILMPDGIPLSIKGRIVAAIDKAIEDTERAMYTREDMYSRCKEAFEIYMSNDSLSDGELRAEFERWFEEYV